MGKFDYLEKKRLAKSRTKEEFINAAGEDTLLGVQPKKSIITKKLLLVVEGNVNRKQGGSEFLFFLKGSLEKEIEIYCSGKRPAILNSLIKHGLDSIKEKGEQLYEKE